MRMLSLFFVFFTLLFVSCDKGEDPIPEEKETPTETKIETYTFQAVGQTYIVVKKRMNWKTAAAYAVEQGGYLWIVTNKAEEDAVYTEITENSGISTDLTVAPDGGMASYIWLGGNDMANEGDWIWDGKNSGTGTQFWKGTADGEAMNDQYTNWGNEPDNYTNQDALGIAITDWPLGKAGQWNDIKDDNMLYFVIEFD